MSSSTSTIFQSSFALLNLSLVKRSNVGGTESEPINPPVGTV